MTVTDHETDFGSVRVDAHGVSIDAHAGQLYQWSHRPGNRWPCSVLDDLDHVAVSFDARGLVDLEADGGTGEDVPADELNAWSSDVLRDVLPKDHAAYFVTVGQFEA